MKPVPPHCAHCCATPVAEGVADETLVEDVVVLRVVEVVETLVVLVLTVEDVCAVVERVLVVALVILLVLVTVPPPLFQPWISSSVRT